MTTKVMKLVDAHDSVLECKKCGQRTHAAIKPDSGGKFYRGSWQCPRGCKLEVKASAYSGHSNDGVAA